MTRDDLAVSFVLLIFLSGCNNNFGSPEKVLSEGTEPLNITSLYPGTLSIDKNASFEIENILRYFRSLPGRKGKRVLAGQYTYNDFAGGNTVDLFNATGQWPAIMEDRIYDDWQGHAWHYERKSLLKDYWNQQRLISLHITFPNPKDVYDRSGSQLSDFEFESIIKDNSDLNKKYKLWLDTLATELGWFQSQNIPLLIRPLHEMNGGWKWYGNRNAATYVKLWQMTIDYLNQSKKLHNLIWVWSPNLLQNGSATTPFQQYYPGSNYVDVIAPDCYQSPLIQANVVDVYNFAKQQSKPFAIAEIGWDASGVPAFSRDSLEIIKGIEKYLPNTVYYSSWYQGNSPAKQYNSKELMSHPLVVDAEALDFKSGQYLVIENSSNSLPIVADESVVSLRQESSLGNLNSTASWSLRASGEPGYYFIISSRSGRGLKAKSDLSVFASQYVGGDEMKWSIETGSSALVRSLKNKWTNKFLSANGNIVMLSSTASVNSSQWQISTLLNYQCKNVTNSATQRGLKAMVSGLELNVFASIWIGGAEMQFCIENVPNSAMYKITNLAGGKKYFLKIPPTSNGGVTVATTYDSSANWRFIYSPDENQYYLFNPASRRALKVDENTSPNLYGSNYVGTGLMQWMLSD